jgi:hypothetical protein
VRHLDEHALQLFQHARDPGVPRLHGARAIEPVRRHQRFRRFLRGRPSSGAGRGVGQFDQQHLGPLEVIADGQQQDPLPRRFRDRFRNRRR